METWQTGKQRRGRQFQVCLSLSFSPFNSDILSPSFRNLGELSIKLFQNKLAMVSFKESDQVETRSDEEGFVGAWYAAEIVHLEDQNHCVVEYVELLNEDGHPLQESVLMSNMRPRSPLLSSPLKFRKGYFVEAYYRDGWWYVIVVGTSSNRVSVYFRITHETMDFPPHLLKAIRLGKMDCGRTLPSRVIEPELTRSIAS